MLRLLSLCYKGKTAVGSVLNLPNDDIFLAPPVMGKLLQAHKDFYLLFKRKLSPLFPSPLLLLEQISSAYNSVTYKSPWLLFHSVIA